MKKGILLITILFVSWYAQPQDLYMPRNIKEAYHKETRSIDGRPGNKYWQNYGRYNITISAMPPGRMIKGNEDITYTNNSPDSLKNLIIRIIANIHKPGAERSNTVSADYLTAGVTIDSLLINGTQQTWVEDGAHNTWYPVTLPQRLLPKDSVRLHIAWHYDVSKKAVAKAAWVRLRFT